jgi:hypothetical protein
VIQQTLIAFVQLYVAIGLMIGVVMSLSPRRMWRQAFKDAKFYPRRDWHTYLALAGLFAFIVFWPSLILHATIRHIRRRRK